METFQKRKVLALTERSSRKRLMVIRNCKSKKERQQNWEKEQKEHDLQNSTQTTKDHTKGTAVN
jgi:hypothetical protein